MEFLWRLVVLWFVAGALLGIAKLLGPATRIEMIGWTGDVCFLLGYFLVSQGKIKGEGKLFNYLNLVGAVLFGVYAVIKNATPILVLECFWGSIALIALYRVYRNKQHPQPDRA